MVSSKLAPNGPRDAVETMRRLERIVASAMDGIITINGEQRIVLFNPAAERMFGLPAYEALGEDICRFIPDRYRAVHAEHIHRFKETGETSRQMGSLGAINGVRSNGEEFPIEASISQVDVGGERLSTVILRDITERKAAEDALLESRMRMEGIVESAMDALITVDERGRIILFNPAAERMFGVPTSQAVGAPIERFIPERFRAGHAEHIRRFKETGVTNRKMGALGAISGLRANGEEFPLEASISQVTVAGTKIATVILRDITERKANEEARILLSREVDHRAKNALAVVQSLVSLTQAPTKEEFLKAVRGRVSALGRAHSLLAQNRWEGADLAGIIAEETAPYQMAGQVHIEGPPVVLAASAVQPVSLVIHELATNAAKYGALSVGPGRVDVRWRILPDQTLEVRWMEAGGPPVQPPTVKGFGSTLVRELASHQLRGQLNINWHIDGMQLSVVLPPSIYRFEAGIARVIVEELMHEAAKGIQGGRVLIVEDETLIAMDMSSQLSLLGWDVVGPAATVQEALGLIAETALLDAAILDVNLAGVLVYPVAQALLNKGVPILFCTGYEQLDDHAVYNHCPIVRKPIDFTLLAAELQRTRLAA